MICGILPTPRSARLCPIQTVSSDHSSTCVSRWLQKEQQMLSGTGQSRMERKGTLFFSAHCPSSMKNECIGRARVARLSRFGVSSQWCIDYGIGHSVSVMDVEAYWSFIWGDATGVNMGTSRGMDLYKLLSFYLSTQFSGYFATLSRYLSRKHDSAFTRQPFSGNRNNGLPRTQRPHRARNQRGTRCKQPRRWGGCQ